MQERVVCCFGSRRWTRWIGWFELIFGLFEVFLLITSLLRFNSGESQSRRIVAGILLFHGTKVHTFNVTQIYFYGWSMTLQNVVDILLAILLLRASYKHKPRLLRLWIIFRVALAILWALLIIKDAVFEKDEEEERLLWMLLVCVTGSVEMFCIWVVRIYEKEMKRFRNKEDPDCSYGLPIWK